LYTFFTVLFIIAWKIVYIVLDPYIAKKLAIAATTRIDNAVLFNKINVWCEFFVLIGSLS